jgi:sRNA-binding protein
MTDPQRTIAMLIERFPECFSTAQPRPLAIGVFHDIRAAAPKIDADELSAALAEYTSSISYLEALTKKNARRVGLSGDEVGRVAPAEAERARRMLGERHLARAAR